MTICTICGRDTHFTNHHYVWGDLSLKKCDDFPVCNACQNKIGWYHPFDKKIRNRIRDESDKWNKIQDEQIRRKFIVKESIQGSSCCTILRSHAELLKDDPERLSTDFIKKMSKCECKKQVVDQS